MGSTLNINPASRCAKRVIHRGGVTGSAYINRRSQITRKTPRKRLKARRAKNLTLGRRRFFPNPRTPGINSPFVYWAKVDTRDGGFEYGMDAVTPVSWIFGRSRVLPKARYIWTLPDTPEIASFVKAQRGKTFVATKNELARDLSPGGKYRRNPASARAVFAQVKRGGNWVNIAKFTKGGIPAATSWARGYANSKGVKVRLVGGNPPAKKYRANPAPTKSGQKAVWKSGKGYSKPNEIVTITEVRGNLAQINSAPDAHEKAETPGGFYYWVPLTELTVLKTNPAPELPGYPQDEIESAIDLRERFSGEVSKTGRKVSLPRPPRVGFDVGPVLLVGYETVRDGKREKYVHEFAPQARPHLVTSHDGRHLYMLGGAYRFTERGIVDHGSRRKR